MRSTKITTNIQTEEDLQKYLLASSEIEQLLQEEIDLQVTDRRLNDARVRNQLDSLYKNVLWRTTKLSNEATQRFLSGDSTPKDIELKWDLKRLKKLNKDFSWKNANIYRGSD